MNIPNHGLDFNVSIPLIRDSMNGLGEAANLIVRGQADDYKNCEANRIRQQAGECVFRLRKMLNFGSLSGAECKLNTIRVLKNVWELIEVLEYGSDLENPFEYNGPLFFPNEFGPNGKFRNFDERFVSVEDNGFQVSDEERELLSETKYTTWSWFDSELAFLMTLLAPPGNSVVPDADTSNRLSAEAQEHLDDNSCDLILELDSCPIELKYRTKEMTKKEAAILYGIKRSECLNLQRRFSAILDSRQKNSETRIYWKCTRQRWIFDYEIFPESVWEKIR